MIPSKHEWQAYSPLEKWGFVSAVATLVGLVFAVYIYVVPAATPLSIPDKVAKDDNPTKLEIEQVTVQQWLGDAEPYVTVSIRNTSKRTALGVVPRFIGEKGEWKFTPTKTSSLYRRGVAIEGGATVDYPVAPLSEFLRKTQSKCQDCDLAAIGTDANVPEQVKAKICTEALKDNGGCAFSWSSIPTPINVTFKTIFDESAEMFFAVFSHFKRNQAA